MSGPVQADTPKEIRERHKRQFAKKVTHHDGWAIPKYIVMCESDGKYRALNRSSGAGGAYQIIPSTWRSVGGRGLPHLASKREQHIRARKIWKRDGPGAWSCR